MLCYLTQEKYEELYAQMSCRGGRVLYNGYGVGSAGMRWTVKRNYYGEGLCRSAIQFI